MGLFKKFKKALPAVGAAVGFAFGGPTGAALGSGIGSLASGKDIENALINSALAYGVGAGAQSLGFQGGRGMSSFTRVPQEMGGFDAGMKSLAGAAMTPSGMAAGTAAGTAGVIASQEEFERQMAQLAEDEEERKRRMYEMYPEQIPMKEGGKTGYNIGRMVRDGFGNYEDIDIDWPLEKIGIKSPLLSEKDSKASSLKDLLLKDDLFL